MEKFELSRRCFVVCLVLVFPFFGLPQTPTEKGNQGNRIGLVLSGGGARGLAHIGVLKALEELEISYDLITGTSMGAVVGGLHASGLSVGDLETIALTTDWEDILRDRPSRRRLPYRRKVDELSFLIDFEVGLNDWDFQLPTGLISGQKLQFFLQTKLLPVTFINQFLELPIPFFTTATDLETGELVILKSGDLAKSIRASMSVPGVFSPVKIEDRYLVDGGLRSNLPVEIGLEMGADRIIAVNVGSPLAKEQELNTMETITKQMVDLLLEQNVERSKQMATIIIEPILTGMTASQFGMAREMIAQGYRKTMEMKDQLKAWADPFFEERTRMRKKPEFPDKPIISVQLSQDSEIDPHMILRKITIKAGDKLDIAKLSSDLSRLYEMGYFETVGFELLDQTEGYILIIDAFVKPWGPNTIRFGLNLESDLEGQGNFNLKANYTITQINRMDAQWKTSVQVGDFQELFSEFYQPLTFSDVPFVAVSLRSNQYDHFRIEPDNTLAAYDVATWELDFDLGLSLKRFGEVRVGYFDNMTELETQNMVTEIEFDGLKTGLFIDQLDNTNFPQNGHVIALEYTDAQSKEEGAASRSFERIALGGLYAYTHKNNTFMLNYEALTSIQENEPPSQAYYAGGLFQVSGSNPGQFVGHHGVFSSLIFYHRIKTLPPQLGSGVYLGGSVEAGNMWEHRDQFDLSDVHLGGSLFFGADTRFGPIYFAYGLNDLDQDRFYFFLGRSF